MSRFLDTNVLLYSISTATSEREKRDTARQLLNSAENVLSVQVLQEFYVQSTRVTRDDALAHDTAVGLIETWLRFPVQGITTEVLRLALALRARHGWSYWDSAIVAAAIVAGCSTLLTEDLNADQEVEGVRILNPFKVDQRSSKADP